ncbi:T9SS type A sorting domain-containing protein, partial [candidate division KSB1 bacterium]|nr:T9SS type A sorting domain-containing protein [candidate division KSB1 bacterium]
FVEATQDVGLDLFNKPNQTSLNVGDLDNDGDEDVFIQINDWTGDDIEALLLNDESEGVRSFVDVAAYTGMTVQGDRKGSAILDYDMDGLLDVFIPSLQYGSILYHNLGPETPNNWIGFDLWGIQSNKDALGSWVTLYAGGKKQVRYTKAGQTWKLQDKPYVHFGIGQATSVDSVVICWSLGNKQVLINPAINQYHKIEESSGTDVLLADIQEPQKLILAQNYPNPFNPTTTIHYILAKTEDVTLKIFNVRGEEISTLIAGENKPAGQHSIRWNGKDDHGSKVSSGIYIYQLQAGEVIVTKKMSLIE